MYAAKKITCQQNQTKAFLSELINSLQFKKRSHENIVEICDDPIIKASKKLWIFMEFCIYGDLNNYFRHHVTDPQNLNFKINAMYQISKGLAYLHECDIIHRDIKPGNILVTRNASGAIVFKLSDFGLAKVLNQEQLQTSAMESNVGTKYFKAPEFWDRAPDGSIIYHRDVDVFACGVTFMAILQYDGTQSTMEPKAEGSLDTHSEAAMAIGKDRIL